MVRQLRVTFPGALYHITSRGNERKNIFITRKDYVHFLEILSEAKEKYQFYLYGYVLMRNHYHLVIESPLGNLSKIMHAINTRYTVYFNRTHRRSGHLFQGRYKSFLVEKDKYLLVLTRYIHLNPVRSAFVSKPEEYEWSSYRNYLKKEESSLLDLEKVLGQLSTNAVKARRLYRQFVQEMIDKRDPFLEEVRHGFVIGSEGFLEKIKEVVWDRAEDKELPVLEKLKKDLDVENVIGRMALYHRVSGEEISRRSRENLLRKETIYLAKKLVLKNNDQIGGHFGISGSAVSHQYQWVSKKVKMDKSFSKQMEDIERFVSSKA